MSFAMRAARKQAIVGCLASYGDRGPLVKPASLTGGAAGLSMISTMSLREQMDRHCKQPRLGEHDDNPYFDSVENEGLRSPLKSSVDHYPAVGDGGDLPPLQQPYVFDATSAGVAPSEHLMPGKSVFDVDAYPPPTSTSLLLN